MKLGLILVLVCTLIRGYEGVRNNVISDVIFKFYNGNSMSQYVDIYLNNGANLVTTPGFDLASPTVFYAHGFEETENSTSVQLVISTYLEMYPDSNIVFIDWSNMAGGNFLNAAPNTRTVGNAVALEIQKMVALGLDPSTVHLVGHSLGSHVVGFTGRLLKSFNIIILRATGLDPAFPGFYPGIFLMHINKDSAAKVDIIHTDAGVFGAPVHTGVADFWVNGGTPLQPGCQLGLPLTAQGYCSHWVSWRVWAESLRTPNAFPAVPYSSYQEFKCESIKKNKPYNYMGVAADAGLAGDYYLQTNSASPYARGEAGTVYKP